MIDFYGYTRCPVMNGMGSNLKEIPTIMNKVNPPLNPIIPYK